MTAINLSPLKMADLPQQKLPRCILLYNPLQARGRDYTFEKKTLDAYVEGRGPAEGLQAGSDVSGRQRACVEVQLGHHVDGAVDGRPPELLPLRVAPPRAGDLKVGPAVPGVRPGGAVGWGGVSVRRETDAGDGVRFRCVRGGFGCELAHGRSAHCSSCTCMCAKKAILAVSR